MATGPLLWLVSGAALVLGVLLGAVWQSQRLHGARRSWPRQWNLAARPIFNAHERALYRDLRLALPNHVILAKVGLLRFCQSDEGATGGSARDWYERLQALHVTFAVCTPAGTVVSAIDMAPPKERAGSRSQKIKEATLLACRVRYVRCLTGQWPQPSLIAAWVLGQDNAASAIPALAPATDASSLHDAGNELARKLKARRAERAARWAESSFSQDSFFAGDSRFGTHAAPGRGPDGQDANGLDDDLRNMRASG